MCVPLFFCGSNISDPSLVLVLFTSKLAFCQEENIAAIRWEDEVKMDMVEEIVVERDEEKEDMV